MTQPARNKDGTFQKGVSGNPDGRPLSKKNQITNLKQDLEIAIRQNVTHKQISGIVNRMVEEALNGSVGAAKLILDKTISNAKENDDPIAGSGGITVVVKNATLAARNEDDRDIIDITPQEES